MQISIAARRAKEMEAVLDGKRTAQKPQILRDLEEYCALDTLAIVEIYRKLASM